MKCPLVGTCVVVLMVLMAPPVVVLAETATEIDTPILLGATISGEGKFKTPSYMIHRAMELWCRQVNESGGLLGRPVKLVVYDDKSRADLVRKYYEKLIVRDKVDLIMSPYGTTLTIPAARIAEKHGKVMMVCGAASETIWQQGFRGVFGLYCVAGRYFTGLMDVVARHGLQTVAVLHEEGDFPEETAQGAIRWAERFGLNIVMNERFHDTADGPVEPTKRLISLKPDVVVFSGYPPASYRFLELLDTGGWKPAALGMTIAPAMPDFAQKAGDISEGIYGPSQWEPVERIPFPGTEKFVHDFQTFTGTLPAYHAGSAYAACQIYERALERIGVVSQDALRAYVLSLDTVTVIGRFKVNAAGMQIGHSPLTIQWQHGKKEIVYPTRMRTAPPKFRSIPER